MIERSQMIIRIILIFKKSTNIFLLGVIDEIENYLPAFINELKLDIQRSLDVKL